MRCFSHISYSRLFFSFKNIKIWTFVFTKKKNPTWKTASTRSNITLIRNYFPLFLLRLLVLKISFNIIAQSIKQSSDHWQTLITELYQIFVDKKHIRQDINFHVMLHVKNNPITKKITWGYIFVIVRPCHTPSDLPNLRTE